ncbi:MAG: hypothetical protein CVU85_06180 [Firmicutes bacterium HGW-Firmicutes-10]|jgi:hypothetical protein|nr:MAG: hypothetical protein CVU85_06180 [Firmicutes bacterium HGW-Firmicutes-10]
MKKLVVSLVVTGILLLGAGLTGLFLSDNDFNTREEKTYTLDELTDNVEELLDNYDEPLKISMIYVFESRDPYFLITEIDTGRGAMELRANTVTGQVYPDPSVARMWNVKYMQRMGNRRIMGSGMMGGYIRDYDWENELTHDEALEIAQNYVTLKTEGIVIDQNHHEFYGYYAYHLLKDSEIVGILRVNGFNGQVAFSRFTGTLAEINK